MIIAWLNHKLQGTPDRIITYALLAVGVTLIVMALTAPPWLKMAALAWAVAP